jgi:hypothetical protein
MAESSKLEIWNPKTGGEKTQAAARAQIPDFFAFIHLIGSGVRVIVHEA